ncbi:phosphate ABC transporter permease PstA [Mumia zhuanghuii]|uniref:Phosphate transport system permease protein PstA n=2 Tax=Mumia TaxID=1546255 RepID=A0ABW1QRB5_9ACTN|nr:MULTISPECIES: phosphate ABC transporter permease PstA [Mumia]KAA1424493.1 phosphate ABC transporter permease PstA [Mumia zhuanghuii]
MSTLTTPPPGGTHRSETSTAEDAPRTFLRAELPQAHRDAVPEERRLLTSIRPDDRLAIAGSWIAAACLAWVICRRLMPWDGVLPFVVVMLVCALILIALTTALTGTRAEVGDRVASALVHAGALTVGIALVSTIVFVFARGAEALPHLNLFTEDMSGVGPRDPFTRGGVLHAILGTLIQVAIAVVITVPLGIGAAVFMTEVGGPFARVVRTVVEAMTALPSIVAGLFIYTTLIVTLGVARSGIAAALALSVMMLPIIARAADVVLRIVPGGLREASLALGSSRWRTVWHVVLPTARPGLATALILGVARGIGETSPVLLTSGAASFVVVDPTDGVMNSLPLFIFSTVRSGEPIYIQRAFAAAAVLMALVLILFVVARLLARPRKGTR